MAAKKKGTKAKTARRAPAAKAKLKKAARAVRSSGKKAAKKVARVAKPKGVQPVPPGYHTITPSLVVSDASAAIEFYKNAFGATVRTVMPGPGGKVMHAELQIGDSIFMLGDEMPGFPIKSAKTLGGSPASFMIYTANVDAAFERAIRAGATIFQPLQDMFWGDRYGQLFDPFGNRWALATHVEDVSEEEMARRMAAMGPPPGAEVSASGT